MENRRSYRHTKIIFTVGPATASTAMLESLIRAGVDICRLNMAHATHDWTRETVQRVREACRNAGRDIATLMDVKGPEIRTGALERPLMLAEGDLLELWTHPLSTAPPMSPERHRVEVNYPDLGHDVQPGNVVLVDSGLLRFEIQEITQDFVLAKILTGGELGSRRHINLPGVDVNLPSLTEKDIADIRVGVETGVDLVALSFVRSAAAIHELRALLGSLGSPAQIVAKIENQAGLRNLEEIARASDAIMVARGDLGIEIPFEQLPLVQDQSVKLCLSLGKPVIIATQMLESMVANPFPTRAEITDIANAVREQADCLMLSGETTTGKYPLECVEVMHRIIDATESLNSGDLNNRIHLAEPKAKLTRSAAVLALEMDHCGILLFTRKGVTAQIAAALRPNGIPIYAFTDQEPVYRQMQLLWGIEPFQIEFDTDHEKTICNAMAILNQQGWCRPGERLAVLTTILEGQRTIDVLQIRYVEPCSA